MPTPEQPSPAPSARAARTPDAGWLRRSLGGAIGAVVCVAIVLTLGVVALSPLGAQASSVGVLASFTTVVVSAALFSALSRSALAAGGASSATSLITAALVTQVVLAEEAAGGAATALAVVVTISASVVLMGLLQWVMAVLNLARLARYVPQPVLAGFMVGVAVLIVVAQLPALLNLAPALWRAQGMQALAQGQVGPLALGLGTAALVWLLARRAPRAPAALLGMLAGVLVFHAARWVAPGLALGDTMGSAALPHTLPGLLVIWDLREAVLEALARHASTVTITAVLLALVGSLESMLNFRATDQQLGSRHDETQDLLVMGLCNVCGGLLGALPMVQVRARAVAILQAGGHGRMAGFGAAAASALMIGIGGSGVAQLPQAVLAGVMITVALSLIDPGTWCLLRQGRSGGSAVRTSLTITALVCVLTVWQGAAAGVAAGVLLSTAIFVRGMNRSLLRACSDAAAQPSRRVYPTAVESQLHEQRHRIKILELEGALFFGTAERVADEAELLAGPIRYLILDLRRVGTIDESGAMVLRQLEARLAGRGVDLLLAGVGPASARRQQLAPYFDVVGAPTSEHWFQDIDRAVEFAELRLLAEIPIPVNAVGDEVPVLQSNLLAGLTPTQRSAVEGLLQLCELKAGQRLFSEGDPALGVYVLSRGSVSIVNASGQRYASFSPGTLLGELAMLDGRGRSANAVADLDCVLHLLTHDALTALAASDPPLCTVLYRNIALQLATRLRAASDAWKAAAA